MPSPISVKVDKCLAKSMWTGGCFVNPLSTFNLRKKKDMIILESKRKAMKVWDLGDGMMHSGPLRTSGSVMSSTLHKRFYILAHFS